MPEAEGRTQRSASVAGRGLDPDVVERAFAQQPAVADAVQRDAASEAEIWHARFAVSETRHLQHDLLGDVLNRSRQIHFALGQLRFRLPRGASEQRAERVSGHRQPMGVREVLHVHPQTAVVSNLDADGP